MIPNLSTLLSYQNKDVFERYVLDYPNNQLTPEDAFQELMKFFWLSLKHEAEKLSSPNDEQLVFICGIHSEMKEIDDMWHTFLLFTKEYMVFCKEYLGRFFHHCPTTEDQKSEFEKNDFETDFFRFLSFVYEQLGEQTLRKWFGSLVS